VVWIAPPGKEKWKPGGGRSGGRTARKGKMENRRWVWCGLHRPGRKKENQAVGVVRIAPPGKEKWKIGGGCDADCTAREEKNENQAVGVVRIAPPGKKKWKIGGGCGVDCTAWKEKKKTRRWVWCGLHRPGRKNGK